VAALGSGLVLIAAGRAADQVTLYEGRPVQGKVIEMSPAEVVVEQGPLKKKVPVNEISWISFDEEPSQVSQARQALLAGQLARAQDLLAKVSLDGIDRAEIKQEIEFLKAIVATRLALAGGGSKADAGRALLAFEKSSKGHYRYLQACEALGDLLVSMSRFDQADAYYAKLAAAPWPNMQLRAGVLVGRSLQARKQHDKAIAKFDEVLAAKAEGKDALDQQQAAQLDKAVSLAATGKAQEAIALVEKVLQDAPEESTEIHARGYTALGNCYRAAGQDKHALWAFLAVDLLFSQYAEQHAEALANLVPLWEKSEKADRAKEAQAKLQTNYPGSRWAAPAGK
jgi:tetratricopeptide (TPR) repeat protein